MCEAMLVFGGHAQNFYQTHLDDLASKDLSAETISKYATVDENELNTASHSGKVDGIVVSSQLVDLDSNVKLRVYFAVDNPEDWNTYTFSLTRPAGNGTTTTTETLERKVEERVSGSGSQTLYYVEVEVPPAYWNDNYVINVTSSNYTGQTYTVTTSVMTWVKSCIEANKSTNDDKLMAETNMAKAMYYYSLYADAYFASKAEQ